MAVNGTYASKVLPSGPNGTMVVTTTNGAVSVSYAGTPCTVQPTGSNGDALSFTYTVGTTSYTFHGACANRTYRGTCTEQDHPRPDQNDNWTATDTGSGGGSKP